MNSSQPCISVLVRSTGRTTLDQAVGSVLAQTWRPVRVKLLVVTGEAPSEAILALAGAQLDIIDGAGRLDRAEAANRVLESADTPLALFLDDDDWLMPDHLARLKAALDEHPDAVAAYAGVECRRADDPSGPAVHVYDHEVRLADMQLQNHLPIHAVLFRTAVVRQAPALRFDETLSQFEDWDFWVRLFARGRFVRVPGVSAVYRLSTTEGSGHADLNSRLRQHSLLLMAARQLARWTPPDVVGLIDQHAALQARINQATQHSALLAGQMADLQAQSQARQDEAARRISLLSAQLDDRDSRVHALQAANERIQDDVVALQGEVAALQAEQARLHRLWTQSTGVQDALGRELAAVYRSASWRVTGPLRSGRTALARLRPAQVSRVLRNLSVAVTDQLRRHGWLGLLRRAPGLLSRWRQHLRALSAAPSPRPSAFQGARVIAPRRPHPEIDGIGDRLNCSVSVVIPTLNAGAEFASLLKKLAQQRGVERVELVIVDSGSTDGTVETARAMGATLVQISPSEFSHSHARNLGADAASGDHLIFMVQDAYPIGDTWIYAMLSWLQAHRSEGVVAASCSEYCRSDSDLMYDSMVYTHYNFLGCREADRIGSLQGTDHMALRSMGQLSDVACLIPSEVFQKYRYRGDYAEDLDLGIRLIRDGHRVAMLASVKVVHSHLRPAYYYLKRSFVDVIFLVGLFDDFHCPPCGSSTGLVRGAGDAAALAHAWLQRFGAPASPHGLEFLAPAQFAKVLADGEHTIGDVRLDAFIERLLAWSARASPGNTAPAGRDRDARQFMDSFMARIDHFQQYLQPIYADCDARLRREVADGVAKVLASTLGSALAFFYLERRRAPPDDPDRLWIDAICLEMKAGV